MSGLRKTLTCLLAALLLLAGLPAGTARAASVLTLPADLKSIGEHAFYGDLSLRSVVLPEGLVSIGSGAFADSSLSEITLPSSLTSIARDAFEGAPLKTVHVEKGTYAYQWMRENGYITEYRALLIGEQSFLWFANPENPDEGCGLDNRDQRNVADVYNLSAALGRTVGPYGIPGPDGRAFQVTSRINLSYADVRNAIRTTFADTREQDISVFFIATHGDDSGDGDLRMAFTGSIGDPDQIAAYWKNSDLSFSTLASWLNTYVKGRVFIILESCGAGSSIYDPSVAENAAKRRGADPAAAAERFVTRAVGAFAAADPGVPVPSAEGKTSLRANSTGDLRQPKFYVLAASRHHEVSYGEENNEVSTSFNYFTKWLVEGIGSKGASPADANSNGTLCLKELFNYIRDYGTSFVHGGVTYYQHVQCYPLNNSDVLLKLN